MKPNNFHVIFSVCLFILLTAGCMSVPPVPTDKFYSLPVPSVTYKGNKLDGILAIRRFVSDGLHNERAMLHADSGLPNRIESYHYHFWADTPPRMIQEHLLQALRKTGISEQVVSYSSQLRPSYVIFGKVRKFQQLLGKQPGVVVAMELQLLKHGERKALLISDYQEVIATSSETIDEAVDKYAVALDRIYNRFLADIAGVS
jgi:ABC-type uncharacterized transport system auxiliary subunit